MSTVLITGGCGFIGSHFVRLLHTRTSHRIVNLDTLTYAGDPARLEGVSAGERYRFVRGDITDAQTVKRVFDEESPGAVVNFAAESHVDRSILDASPFVKTNIEGVQVLLEAARRHGAARFLHVSTDEVYGDVGHGGRSSEDAPLRPSSPYAASKAAADLLCLAYRRTYGLPCLVVRSSNNYGAWQYPEKLIPLMISKRLDGHTIPVYGDGTQRRDWLHVSDNCRGILLALERGRAGFVYNIAASEERTNLDVIAAVCRALADAGISRSEDPSSCMRCVPDRPGHDTRYAIDAGRIRRELGWRPQVTFDHGIRDTVRWYIEHREWLARASGCEFAAYHEEVYARSWGRV